MKKGEIPKLDSEWWKKNKAKTLLKTGVGEAIRVYEAKMDKFDYAGAITALIDVGKKAEAAAKKCNDTLHDDTKQALLKYPKVLTEEVKRLKGKIEEEKKKAEEAKKNPPAPKQKVGDPEVLWSKDIGKYFMDVHGKNIEWLTKLEGGECSLRVNKDIRELLIREKAEVIAQRMVDSANKVFNKALLKIATDAAAEVDDTLDGPAKLKALTKIFEKEFKATEAAIKLIPGAEWKKFVGKKQQYKEYQVKVGVNFVLTGLKGVGTGLAIAAAIPTGGASLALAVVGAVNTVADAIRQIRDAAQECETVIKRLAKNLDKMNKEFQDTKKKAGAQAKEVGKTIADTILNYPLFPTVKTCGDDCTLADNKSAGLNVKHVKLGGDVSKALKKLDDLDKFLAKAKTNKEIAKIQKDVIKIRKTLDEALKKTSAIGERVTFCEDLVEQCQELLVEVEAGAGKWLTVFEKVFPIVYNLAMAGANAGVGFVDAKNALETANTALGLTNDVLTEVKNNIPD